MTAHLSDSDRQALRLAHDLREEMRHALPDQTATPSVSPFVDPAGRPAVLMRMDDETARALMALLTERRAAAQVPPQELRRPDGTAFPPVPGQAAPPHPGPPHPGPAQAAQQPVHYQQAPPEIVGVPPAQPTNASLLPSAFPTR